MTIFDTLRYHISIPPSAEELSRLPNELFEHWLEDIGYGNIMPVTPQQVAVYFEFERSNLGNIKNAIKDVELLRKMITEYNMVEK